MAAENLADVISALPPDEQESVKKFVEFLKQKGSASSTPFLAAVDEFIHQHPNCFDVWLSDLLPNRGRRDCRLPN
jgi:hypothetical protein